MKKNTKLSTSMMKEIHRNISGFLGSLPNPNTMLGRRGLNYENLRKLKDDPHVWSSIQSRKSGISQLEHIISPNGVAEHIVNKIKETLSKLDLKRLFKDILDAPLYGFQPLEIIWEVRGQSIKHILPSEVKAKPQEWFEYDNKGKLRFSQGISENGKITKNKIINVEYESTYLNPYGQSLLAKCYWPVTFKNGALRFWVNFAEKYGMPILTGKYTRGATQEETQILADELANMAEDAVIVMPSDIELKFHEANRDSSIELYRQLIKFSNNEISKAILSQTLTTEIGNGSLAAAETHYRIRQQVIRQDAGLIESAINQLINMIVDLNYRSDKYPQFRFILNDSENTDRAERDIKLVSSGQIKFSKEYWKNTYGFKEDEFELV